MLEAEIKTQLGEYMTRLVTPVQITAYVDGGKDSQEMLDLLADVGSVSDKVTVTTSAESGGNVPRFALASPGQPARIAFAGLPMGHEFTSLVLALLQTGGYPPKLDASVIEQIRNLEGDFEFRTYISLSCQNCPDVVQALTTMAVAMLRIANCRSHTCASSRGSFRPATAR